MAIEENQDISPRQAGLVAQTSILLHQVEGPINLGSTCRAMANTGFQKLAYSGRLSGLESAALRFAIHAQGILKQAQKQPDIDGLLDGLDVVFGFSPRDPWTDGRQLDLDGFHREYAKTLAEGKRIGLLFGNEMTGLANADLARCSWRVSLPTAKTYVSMNLAQAVLVVLWELHRAAAREISSGDA